MTDKNTAGVEQYASKGILIFSGSLLVLSVSLNNAGFGKVVDAYAQAIVYRIEHTQQCELDLNKRLIEVERKSHESKEVKPE